MAEKSSFSVASTPKRVKDLLWSFIHKEESNIDERCGESNEESAVQYSRSFQPRNKEAFFSRLETFSLFTWFAKPVELSPPRCAQYGWENTDNDILKCVSCKEILCGLLPADPELYAKRCEELKNALVKSHSGICPWADSPSPDYFLSVPLLSQSEAQKDFKSRCSALMKIEKKMPLMQVSSIESAISAESFSCAITALLKLLDQVTEDCDKVLSDASCHAFCILSVCGWSSSSTELSQYPTVCCQYCRREAGLWNFTSLDDSWHAMPPRTEQAVESTEGLSDAEEPSPKKRKTTESPKSGFNPLTEHKTWCPWVMSYSQRFDVSTNKSPIPNYSNKPGWLALMSLLTPQISLFKEDSQRLTDKDHTPHNQAWKAVRKILNFWQSGSKKNDSTGNKRT